MKKQEAPFLKVPNPLDTSKELKDLLLLYRDDDDSYKIFMQAGDHINQAEMLFCGVYRIAEILREQENFPMVEALGIKLQDTINEFAEALKALEERVNEEKK